ncbi:hypothetical protein GCM10028803_13710 [Larkinella knui]|uniref:DUF4129 domain-containing protein n=1 Tax=Larkinella knui TaxID=2025310 RepID=A0A3P1CBI2_9BACT|nr:DUF4129 domain-containing protein [Larkinella knui]RRB10683.1 DUF4129 domain-containing protein [Larkinella knui]
MKVTINRIAKIRLAGFLLLVALSGISAWAQVPVSMKKDTARAQLAPDDRSPVRVRRPSPARLNDYRNDRDYQYGQDFKPANNLWAKFWEWFWRKVGAFLNSSSYQNFWQYVFLAAAAGLVIWLLIKAEILGFIFSKGAKGVALNYETLTENIHEIDFEQQIDAAVAQRNYRLAVRLLYLQTLKHLSNHNLIDWKPNKTNRSYVYELAQSPLQPEFETLTTQFEYIWYGDFPITEERFKPLQESFLRFRA